MATANPAAGEASHIWTFADRVYCGETDGFSSYAVDPTDSRPEETSLIPVSWAGANMQKTPYLPTRVGENINWHISKARLLHPRFLLMGEWNQFVNDGGGYSIDARYDFEPTFEPDGTTVDTQLYSWLQAAISDYKTYETGTAAARFTEIVGMAPTSWFDLTFTFEAAGFGNASTPVRTWITGTGPSLAHFLPSADCAHNPQIQLFDPSGQSSLSLTNSNWTAITSVSSGSSLVDRYFYNSPFLATYLNYGAGPLATTEPAITADLTPVGSNGTPINWTIYATDAAYSGGAPGPLAHVRVVPVDSVTGDRMHGFSLNGYVSCEGTDNNVNLGFTLDGQKQMQIQAFGPSLAPYFPGTQVLQVPVITVYAANGSVVATWSDEAVHTLTLGTGTPSAGGELIQQPSGQSPSGTSSYTVVLASGSSNPQDDGVGHIGIWEP